MVPPPAARGLRLIITLVVAVADNGVIGRDNALPWHLPEDLKRFKQITLGKPIVMGRKTYDSIGRPLPGRQNIVLTRDADYRREGVTVVHSVESAITAAAGAAEIMVIGGAGLFEMFMPQAQRIHLTRVHGDVSGDVFWHEIDPRLWCLVDRMSFPADERHAHSMSFELWARISG
jgi:dihydrofolate reductase